MLVRPGRQISGHAAVLLPFSPAGAPDWPAFTSLLHRTAAAGLTPAVNMDTGFVNLLTPAERAEVLARTRAALAGQPFVGGVFVDDRPGAAWDPDAYRAAAHEVVQAGGTPIVFPSYGLTGLEGPEVVAAHETVGQDLDTFYAFELSPVFVPFGRVYPLDVFEGLLGIRACTGAKHSSLSRAAEWARLEVRDRVRPGFRLFTGNDLAIDMVMWGSDYLLGLAAFAPDLFAARDRLWAAEDPAFYEANDALQALGDFTFRPPVPAYKHSCAQMLHLRGWLDGDSVHPDSPRRPDSDREVLTALGQRLGVLP
jgi:dihydrodipicolinate synthase/N-acetylneuraminate lyase